MWNKVEYVQYPAMCGNAEAQQPNDLNNSASFSLGRLYLLGTLYLTLSSCSTAKDGFVGRNGYTSSSRQRLRQVTWMGDWF